MIKTLQTCFLALLCLSGSTFSAQSKVAESPGAGLLHRFAGPTVSPHSGDTHRRGAILSDTFLKSTAHEIDGGPMAIRPRNSTFAAESTSDDEFQLQLLHSCGPSTVDCGPNLPSSVSSLRSPVSGLPASFSLVDQHLDPGAGEGTINLQSAPVTVLDSSIWNDQKTIRKTPDSGSLRSPVSRLPSQHPFAHVGEGMLYIEIHSPNPPDTLWITYWEHLLRDQLSVTPGNTFPVSGSYGNIFEGSLGKRVYRLEFPPGITDGFFSIGKGKSTLIHQWYFSSSDRIRIRFDLVSGKTMFGGPDANFYRTQYLMDQLFAQEQFNNDPLMVSASREGLFQDSLSAHLYEKALDRLDDLSVKLKVLVSDSERWGEFLDRTTLSLDRHPASGLLRQAADYLTAHQLSLLSARIAGELLSAGLTWAELGKTVPETDPAQFQKLMDWIAGFGLDGQDIAHPLLVQGESRLISLLAGLNDKKWLEEWTVFPSPLKDEVLAIYLLENFNSLGEELLPLLDSGQKLVSTPWISEKLGELASVYRSPIVSERLIDASGNSVDLRDFSDQTLLIHFWISGCRFCMEDYRLVMEKLAAQYADRPEIRIISINLDSESDSWLKSLATGRYTSPMMLNLKAPKSGNMATYYRIHSFPQKMIIGRDSHVRLQLVNHMDSDKLADLLDRISTESSLSFSPTQTIQP